MSAAIQAYRIVLDSGHRDAAPRAANNLGNIVDDAGDRGEAARPYVLVGTAAEFRLAGRATVCRGDTNNGSA